MHSDEHTRIALEALGEGKEGPVGELLEQYRPRVRRMVGLRMDPRLRSRLDASDVVQEAFVDVTERLPGYALKPDLPFFLWVRYLCGQKLVQLHRKHLGVAARDARREVPLLVRASPPASSLTLASVLAQSGATPSQMVIRAEEESRVLAALESMSEMDREVLVLRHFEQLENVEVARILEVPESTASMRYLRAVGRLEKSLSAKEN